MIDISHIMQKLAQTYDREFTYRGDTIPIEKLFAKDGALPIFVRKAQVLNDFLFSETLSVSFLDDPDSLTGEIVEMRPDQKPFVMIMMLYDVFEEYVVKAEDESSPIALDKS
ncbi:MAG: hypothetical protein COB50_03005 [Thiotrichales bacterium]|nr:MAG: hypothetical protein COB50_03005 [Thiotrichales bacterium]